MGEAHRSLSLHRLADEPIPKGRLKVTLVQMKLCNKLFALLYQGTTSVVPRPAEMVRAFSPFHRKSARNTNKKERRG
jgi:hypothetical protein